MKCQFSAWEWNYNPGGGFEFPNPLIKEHARSINVTTKERSSRGSRGRSFEFALVGYREPRKTEELYENTILLSPAPAHFTSTYGGFFLSYLSPLIQCAPQYEIHQKPARWKGNVLAKQKHIISCPCCIGVCPYNWLFFVAAPSYQKVVHLIKSIFVISLSWIVG